MPYISQDRREILDSDTDLPNTEGELNYVLTRMVIDYAIRKGASYSTFNAIMGVLESVKQEFYRRVVSDYENGKIKANGDVY